MSALIDKGLATKLLDMVADRVPETYFDESSVQYEAARLEHHRVVLVFYFEGGDYEKRDFSRATNFLLVAKGDDECRRYLSGETSSLEFEAVLALDSQAALGLRGALQRRASKLRLVK